MLKVGKKKPTNGNIPVPNAKRPPDRGLLETISTNPASARYIPCHLNCHMLS